MSLSKGEGGLSPFFQSRIAATLAGALAILVVSTGLTFEQIPEVVRARSIQIVDENGSVRATIGNLEGGPVASSGLIALDLRDAAGKSRVTVTASGKTSVIRLADPENNERISLTAGIQKIAPNLPNEANIAGLRFYADHSNTGTHTGSLIDLRVQDGASSLRMLKNDGTVIEQIPEPQ